MRGNRSRSGFSLVELLVAVSIIVFLIAMIAVGALNYGESARRDKTLAAIAAVRSALNLYKYDTRILPMISPALESKERNRLLALALTDPNYGWINARRGALDDFLAGEGEQTYIVDGWDRPFEYFTYKVERSYAYQRVHVDATFVTVTFKCWNQDDKYISNLVIVMPYEEGRALEQYFGNADNCIEVGTDHGVGRRDCTNPNCNYVTNVSNTKCPKCGAAIRANASYPYVLSKSRYYQLVEMHDNLYSGGSGKTTALNEADVRGYIETPTVPGQDVTTYYAPEDEPYLAEVFYAYLFSRGPDGQMAANPLPIWQSTNPAVGRAYARISVSVADQWLPVPRPYVESYNNDNLGVLEPTYRYTTEKLYPQ